MKIFFVEYVEAYQDDLNGQCEEGQWGPWDNKESAEEAMEFLKTRRLGEFYDKKLLYDHLEVVEGFVSSVFKQSQVWCGN
jgi:hypothetical protein